MFCACGRKGNVWPFGWETVSPEADSLMLRLDRGWIEFADPAVIDSLAGELQRLADAGEGPGGLLRVRSDYWQGRIALRDGEYERADSLFRAASEGNDSAVHPYETHRLMWTMEPDPMPRTVPSYEYYVGQTEFFESAGDMMLASSIAMDLGMMLADAGMYDRALRWLDRSDSLSTLMGFDRMVAKNRLNRATIHTLLGDTAAAVAIERNALEDPFVTADENALNILLYNLFVHDRDTTAFNRAHDMAADWPDDDEVKVFYDGCMAGVLLNRGSRDSAITLMRSVLERFSEVSDPKMRKDILDDAIRIARSCNDSDLELTLLRTRAEEQRQLADANMDTRIADRDFTARLYAFETEQIRRATSGKILMLLVILGVVMVTATVILLLMQKLSRERLAAVNARLEHERMERELLAARLKLDRAATDTDSPGDKAARHNLQAFIQTYTEINPGFSEALRRWYPSLTESDIQFLSLMAIGMTTKEIASTLGIRSESVKQARWRLRGKLGLTDGETLDDVVRRANGA